MNSPYNIQLQQLQQQLHEHFMMGGPMNNANMFPLMPMTPTSRQQGIIEPIVVDESEDEDDEEQRTLFVANLDERVTEELLYEAFLQAGPIERARIPKDNAGRQRTFGFVTYNKRCSPPYAMHLLQGLSLFRKTLTIKYKGKNMLPPLKSPVIGAGNLERNYDNSALRSGNFSHYHDSRKRDSSSPTYSSRHQDRISKHASSQMRPHSNSSPYQQHRNSPNPFDKRRHNNSSHSNNSNSNKNGNNRYSDHRNGKYRR
ncbi:uncharacterized protein LOC142226678 [Haematobia irritans]|uniref:uncharacterized protein LOC142226678 n=1 Tax=Haematobia irritans TaxID=7368 RepID=UPI003F505158